MDDDQQFCLRWNNHQSTLVAVFETLLANGILVDCTLAAEGKHLNAHKVVLSACSPYFEALLSKHFDKHPILILKDVKFQELEAMMDYMYKGEVNISQDQLGALLKAAESLQIKGLSDNRKGETERKAAPAPPPPKSPQPTAALPKVQGLTIEQRTRDDSREGSMSPGPRKKKRLRRKSEELDNHDASNSSESHSLPAQNIPSSLPATSRMNAGVPEPVETKSEILTRHKQEDIPQVPIIKEKLETHTELMLEPKSEYVEDMNEDSIEDLTLDDDDLSNMEQMDDQAGPSHGNAGEGSSQGFGGWHMGNQSQDEVFLAAQEAVGAHRDSQVVEEIQKANKLQERMIEHFSSEFFQLKSTTNEIYRVLKNLEARSATADSDKNDTVSQNIMLSERFLFPLNSLVMVLQFNEEITQNAEYKKYLIKTYTDIGGSDGSEDGKIVARKILSKIFTKYVLTLFSWTGISRTKGLDKKESFQSCQGILSFFNELLIKADSRWNQNKTEKFFKCYILKHARQINEAHQKTKKKAEQKTETAEESNVYFPDFIENEFSPETNKNFGIEKEDTIE
ncbi:longitudinals lacking isoform X3 [Leptinotarsa decemlineata]|uniref:longitudinals lacking isoform X3 n=1 Tax=Leptinotarsa decemlineata TaxID=7539 RepID=UPI003D30D212